MTNEEAYEIIDKNLKKAPRYHMKIEAKTPSISDQITTNREDVINSFIFFVLISSAKGEDAKGMDFPDNFKDFKGRNLEEILKTAKFYDKYEVDSIIPLEEE